MANTNNKTAAQAAKEAANQKATEAAFAAVVKSAPDAAPAPEEEDTDDPVVLKQRLVQRDERINSLSEALVNANEENTELQQQLTDERQRSGDLAADLNESEQLTEELQGQLKRAELRQAESDTHIVTDGTHDYKVLLKSFKFKGTTYQAEELGDDQELVQQLVEAGVGFLQKIEE